jgi:hypothetical protein
MKNMAYKVVDRLFLVVYGVANPTDAEWMAYLRTVERHGIDRTVQLVFTRGGRPTSSQSQYLTRLLAGRKVPVAIVSANRAVRGVSMAMSWFNPKIVVFSPANLPEALAYLEIPASRIDLIQNEAMKLRRELETPRQASA